MLPEQENNLFDKSNVVFGEEEQAEERREQTNKQTNKQAHPTHDFESGKSFPGNIGRLQVLSSLG